MVVADTSDSYSLLRVLAKNVELLTALSEGPQSKSDLANYLDVSKKTVYRRVRELIEVGLVVKSTDGYELTAVGRLQMELMNDSISLSETLHDGSNLFAELPDKALPPYWFVIASDVSTGTNYAPDLPLKQVSDLIDSTERLRLFLPTMFSGAVETLAHNSERAGFTAEVVVDSGVVPSLRSEYVPEVESMSNKVRLRHTDSELPFGLLIAERPNPMVAVLVHNTDNGIYSLFENTTVTGFKWATEIFRPINAVADNIVFR